VPGSRIQTKVKEFAAARKKPIPLIYPFGIGRNDPVAQRLAQVNDNNLRGTIPSEIATLANLSTLYLNENQLGGTIPLEIGNMASLTYLNLSDNHDLQLTVTTSSFCNTTPYCGVLPTIPNKLQAIAIDVFGTCADTDSGRPVPSCGNDKNEALEWFFIIANHPPDFEMNSINWMVRNKQRRRIIS
jgi:hypothetical protein